MYYRSKYRGTDNGVAQIGAESSAMQIALTTNSSNIRNQLRSSASSVCWRIFFKSPSSQRQIAPRFQLTIIKQPYSTTNSRQLFSSIRYLNIPGCTNISDFNITFCHSLRPWCHMNILNFLLNIRRVLSMSKKHLRPDLI